VLVVVVFQTAHRPWMDQPSLPTSLIGSALVLFLSVRSFSACATTRRMRGGGRHAPCGAP
jgi:putative membrane protein